MNIDSKDKQEIQIQSSPTSKTISRSATSKLLDIGSNDASHIESNSLDNFGENNESFLLDSDSIMEFHEDSEEEEEINDDVINRLHNCTYQRVRNPNEAIVSILPSETLRWIKKRRKVNSKLKVAMSHFRERQLREIFSGLDYKTEGEINLEDLKKACIYVEDSLRGKRGDQLNNLQDMFAAMDEDGNGSVDFQEFCAGMSGSSKSTIDSASEHAIDKLHWKFVEYSRIYKRQKALDEIYGDESENHLDSERYNSFRTLFNVGWGLKSHTVKNFDKNQEIEKELRLKQLQVGNTEQQSHINNQKEKENNNNNNNTPSKQTTNAINNVHHMNTHHKDNKHLSHSASVSQILFMTEGRKLYMPSKADAAAATAAMATHGMEMPIANMSLTDKQVAYDELQARLRCHRIVAQEHMLRDPDARQIQRRIEQETKYIRDQMSYRPGVLKQKAKATDIPKTFEPEALENNPNKDNQIQKEIKMKLTAIKQAQLLGITGNYNPIIINNNNNNNNNNLDSSLNNNKLNSKPCSPQVRLLKPLSYIEKLNHDEKLKELDKIYSESEYFKKFGYTHKNKHEIDDESKYYYPILLDENTENRDNISSINSDSLINNKSNKSNNNKHKNKNNFKIDLHVKQKFELVKNNHNYKSLDDLHDHKFISTVMDTENNNKVRPISPFVPIPKLSNSTNPLIPMTKSLILEKEKEYLLKLTKKEKREKQLSSLSTSNLINQHHQNINTEKYNFKNDTHKLKETFVNTENLKKGIIKNTINLKRLKNQNQYKINTIINRSVKELGYYPSLPNRLNITASI